MFNSQPILALNCGSSSLKFGFYIVNGAAVSLVIEGSAEEIGRPNASFSLRSGERRTLAIKDHSAALDLALDALTASHAQPPSVVGHRFVHGGPHIRTHQKLTPEVATELEAAASFAPLHVPPALAVLRAFQQRYPGRPGVVCLDTAFHNTLPDVASTFALPSEWRQAGVQRYGFHGISLESVLAQLTTIPERLIVAHLGNGCSITAIHNGRSVDTSMGFTPNAGVMMGTRCGDLDPGIPVFLMREQKLSPDDLDLILNYKSGLLGVSELSSDVRQLLVVRVTNAKANLALRMFCYQVRKAIGAMAAVMGGVDTVIFTGGIGEHAQAIRDEICAGLRFLGGVEFEVVNAQEDLQIARITAALLLPAQAI